MLEDKLAKLYRIAFTRQQARHLGINTNVTNSSSAVERIKRDIQPTRVQHLQPNPASLAENGIHLNKFVRAYESSHAQRRQRLKKVLKRDLFNVATNSSLAFDSDVPSLSSRGGAATANVGGSGGNSSSSFSRTRGKGDYQQIILERRHRNRQKVTVMIHNVTHLTDDDITKSINQDESTDTIKR